MNSLTIAQALSLAPTISAQSDSARLDIEVILAHILDASRTYLYTWPEKHLSTEQTEVFHQALSCRARGEPVAYITGEKEFWSLRLKVSPATLIPRPETELLVELALDRVFPDARVLDLGTGTGAIALAIKSEVPEAQVDALDFSSDAVALARENQQHHGLDVNIFQSDWFECVSGVYDLIISNPPYIDEADKHLKEGDVRFEPESALVAKHGGLADIEVICKQAVAYLHDQGSLLIEHGWTQAEAVQKIMILNGYKNVSTIKDYAGNDRVTSGQWLEDAAY